MFSIFDILTPVAGQFSANSWSDHTLLPHYLDMVILVSSEHSLGQVLQVLQVVGGETPPPSLASDEGDDLEPQPLGESGQT